MPLDSDPFPLLAWLAAARAVHFAFCLLIGGVWSVELMGAATASPRWPPLARRLLIVATAAAFLSGVAWFALVAADMSGLELRQAVHVDVLRVIWLHTRFGRVWQWHVAFWMAEAVAAVVGPTSSRTRWFGTVSAAGLVGGLAWAGHGSTGPAPAWHVSADAVHLIASAIWPGGLLPFALLLGRLARSSDPSTRSAAARITRRFSAASLIAVASLTATGLFDSYCLLGSVGALFTSHYGRVLLIKGGLFVGMLCLGAVNLLVLKPRVTGGGSFALGQLRRSVWLEVLLGAGVVAVVGLLGLLTPARM